ncbi:MAG TPA: nucleotide exchange factor GrpE [Candidatus Xenobia bacterium]|jgi:molecular chaperone GrpE (heat shock protein)
MDCALASQTRRELLARFEQLLDRALEGSPSTEVAHGPATAPPGPAIDGADLYAVWARLTAVTQEVKLQSRVFKQLEEAISPLAERVNAQAEAQEQTLVEVRTLAGSHRREVQRDAEQRERQAALGGLLDMRDRLERGFKTSQETLGECRAAWRPSWWDRMRGRDPLKAVTPAVQALQEGYRLGLERLDELLASWSVRPVSCLHQAFDTHRMQAVDVVESASMADGTVVEVYRTGFEGSDGPVRLAQVKVSRHPKGGTK